jgi:branched-chain amino acid aminotransferase
MENLFEMSISINRVAHSKRSSCPKELLFGAVFSDHMFTQEYEEGQGWHNARIDPYHPIVLDPAAAVVHYGQEIFEGLKAYRRPDGGINLFRPEANMRRFNNSAERMMMPKVDEHFHLAALWTLIDLDREWVPDQEGTSLYIRPAMIATSARLGVGASSSYLHLIITSPAGPYFKGGFKPVSVYVAEKLRRAVVGGVGEAKTGGNYAASLFASEKAASLGYSQVLWLDAVEGRFVEEVGAMNICFVYEGRRIVTPALSGSILPGITRDSVLKLAPELGYNATEEQLDIHHVIADLDSGKISEVFGCGTAAAISPVGKLCLKGRDHEVNQNLPGPVTRHLYDELTGIQYGICEDRFGWIKQLS